LSRPHHITVCLVGFEKHKASPDPRDPSGFWLRAKVEDASPFVAAFNASPTVFHEFRIEQRVGKETRVLIRRYPIYVGGFSMNPPRDTNHKRNNLTVI
jgi:hypothetical protein